jgi:hypothetical protein
MSLANFRIKDFDDETVETEPVTQYTYESDCLDFIPLRAGTTTRYMAVARDSEAVAVNVWVAEKPRTAIVEDAEPVYTGRSIQVAFA